MIAFSKCVVDASVGIKLLVSEELSSVADALFEEMAGRAGSRQYVPDLFFAECANVLWKYVVRHGYTKRGAIHHLAKLHEMNLIRIAIHTVTPTALQIAVEHSISVYDACYVATSQLVEAPLITADERLARRLAGTPYKVRYLGDLDA